MSTSREDLARLCEELTVAAERHAESSPERSKDILKIKDRIAYYLQVSEQISVQEESPGRYVAIFKKRAVGHGRTDDQARSLGIAGVMSEWICSRESSSSFISPDLVPQMDTVNPVHCKLHQNEVRDALGILVWTAPRFYGRNVSYVGHASGPGFCFNLGPFTSRDSLLAWLNDAVTNQIESLLGRTRN